MKDIKSKGNFTTTNLAVIQTNHSKTLDKRNCFAFKFSASIGKICKTIADVLKPASVVLHVDK